MFRASFQIAKIWGIPIKIHFSLILVMFLYASYAVPGGHIAVLFVLLLVAGVFFSVALHELGHSYVAIRKGYRVREITLMFMGGAAMMEDIPRKPRDEIQMAIAGPLVSIAFGLLLWRTGAWMGTAKFTGTLVSQIGIANLWLAGFNLLPSFPMDGGRVFRAILTPKLGRLKATYIAARLGKTISIVFGIYGMFEGPILLVALAFFIYAAAEGEYRMVLMQERGGPWGVFGRWGEGYREPPPPPRPNLRIVPDEDLDEDEVAVSPPPYRKGPGYRTHLRHEDDHRLR